MPRSQRNDNFIDKSFTVMADLILKVLPTNQRAKEAFAYYRDGMSAQADGEYAEALDNYKEALKLEEDPNDKAFILYNMALVYVLIIQANRLTYPCGRLIHEINKLSLLFIAFAFNG